MGFLTSLFGGGENSLITVVLALVIVVTLIVFAVWALKMIMDASGKVTRGRQKRLHVVEVAPVDQKRQLILIKRDDVEHLLLVGGNQELVIETNIEHLEKPETTQASPLNKKTAPVFAKQSRREAQKQIEPVAPNTQRNPAHSPTSPAITKSAPKLRITPVSSKHEDSKQSEKTTANDKLTDLGKPVDQRKSSSLRHTGLLRPVSRIEPAVFPNSNKNTQANPSDSDKPIKQPKENKTTIATEPNQRQKSSTDNGKKVPQKTQETD